MGKTVSLLVPIAESRPPETAARPLPDRLTGARVGFLDNTKANFDLLACGLAPVLEQAFGAGSVVIRRKLNASTPAPPELLAAMSKECEVVLAGSGD